MGSHRRKSLWRRHSLTLIAGSILLLWILLYTRSSPETHIGSFFGNAIADWTGLVVMVLATKHMYEMGSAESKMPHGLPPHLRLLREHSLTIFLVITGSIWLFAFLHLDATSKWGQVIGNIVSEWTQILGLVLLTKRLHETGSKDSK